MTTNNHDPQNDRTADEAAETDLNTEALRLQLAIDLFEGYVTKNYAVVDEVNALLLDADTTDNLINKLREAITEECQRPKMGRGCLMYSAYEGVVDAVCRDIAGRYTNVDEFEVAREEFEL